MSLSAEQKKKTVDEFALQPRDTGSSAVQVALLTERIRQLTEHMKTHQKDRRSQRSLINLVSLRQRHLAFLLRTRPSKYREVVDKLGLRK